jgi:hypothetical protein
MKPECENGLGLIAQHLLRMREDNRRRSVSLVVYRAQKDRMCYADVQQIGGCQVSLALFSALQLLWSPSADQVEHLTLSTHTADIGWVGLVSLEVDQRAFVWLALVRVPPRNDFSDTRHSLPPRLCVELNSSSPCARG